MVQTKSKIKPLKKSNPEVEENNKYWCEIINSQIETSQNKSKAFMVLLEKVTKDNPTMIRELLAELADLRYYKVVKESGVVIPTF